MTATGKRGLLGQVLLTREIITDRHLEDALARQVIHGGRLGSNLIELGSISIEAVADGLSYQVGVPAADLQRIEIDEEVLATIPSSVCDKYKILPLRLQDRTLHLAMQDPWRRDLIDHLSNALHVRIQAYVVPQLRILYALERFCGIPRPTRYLRQRKEQPSRATEAERRNYLEGTVTTGSHVAVDLPAPKRSTAEGRAPIAAPPRLPGADPLTTDAGTHEFQLVFLDDVPRAQPTPPFRETNPAGSIKVQRAPAPASDSAAGDRPVKVPEAGGFDFEVDFESTDARQSLRPPGDARELVQRLEETKDREGIATTLVQPISPHTTLSLLLLPRGELAVALAASGTDLPLEQIRALVVPLNAPSLIQQAFSAKSRVVGDAQADPLQTMLSTYLRAPTPVATCVVPICIGDKVANLLCVQSAVAIPEQQLAELSEIALAGAAAYTRLIQRKQEP